MEVYSRVLEDLILQQKMLVSLTFGVAKLTRIVNLYLDKTSVTMMCMVILLSFQILNMLMYSQEVFHVKIYQTLKHGVQMKNSKAMELKAGEVVYGMSLQELSKKLNPNM